MASFLGDYKGAAKDRIKKFHRAVRSALNQTFSDFELLIIADGCQVTLDAASVYSDPRIKLSLIPKQKTFSAGVRNRGIANAKGEYITYLDTDDEYGPDHLKIIEAGIYYSQFTDISFGRFLVRKEPSWVFFNDYSYDNINKFVQRDCTVEKFGQCGTSNIAHSSALNIYWQSDKYDHDYVFIKDLKAVAAGVKIATPQYYVCHIPKVYDI